MKPRKTKIAEPSLRDKLSVNFLRAFQNDFEANGVDVIVRLREKCPERYVELAAKLIAATEPPANTDVWSECKSTEDIGRELLRQVGAEEFSITPEMIEQALAANERLVETLEAIIASYQTKYETAELRQ
jgi:hypothetical protein